MLSRLDLKRGKERVRVGDKLLAWAERTLASQGARGTGRRARLPFCGMELAF